MSTFAELPLEIKTMVFDMLDPPRRGEVPDLSLAALVSREWRGLAGAPHLWQDLPVTGGPTRILGLLNSPRFTMVKYVELGTREHLDAKAMAAIFDMLAQRLDTLEQVLVSDARGRVELGGVRPGVLARVAARLDAFLVEGGGALGEEQLAALMARLAQPGARLGRLCLPGADLTSLPPDLLAAAVPRLRAAVFPRAKLTEEQVVAVFQALDGAEPARLRMLDLKNVDVSMVEPSVLARVVGRLRAAELYDTRLTRHQLHCLVGVLADPASSLKELNIGGTYDTADPMLPHVHPDILAKAVTRLEVAMLEGLNLTVEQLEEILEEVVEEEAATEVLDISYNVELGRAHPDLVAQVRRAPMQVFTNLSNPAAPPADQPAPAAPAAPAPAAPAPAEAAPAPAADQPVHIH